MANAFPQPGPPTGAAIEVLLRSIGTSFGVAPTGAGVIDTKNGSSSPDYCIVNFAFTATTRYPLEQRILEALAATWQAERIGNHVLVTAPNSASRGRQLADEVWETIARASAQARDPNQKLPLQQRQSAWKRGDSFAVHYADEDGGLQLVAWIVSSDGDEVPAL